MVILEGRIVRDAILTAIDLAAFILVLAIIFGR